MNQIKQNIVFLEINKCTAMIFFPQKQGVISTRFSIAVFALDRLRQMFGMGED